MKVRDIQTGDANLDRSLAPITAALQNLSRDNFKVFELTGACNATADTKQVFNHSLASVPSLWFVLEGDIYIPRNGAGTSTIDIRSRRSSEAFRLLLIY